MKNLFLMLCMVLCTIGSFANTATATTVSEEYAPCDDEASSDLMSTEIISQEIIDEAYFDSCYTITTIRYTYHNPQGIDYEEIVTVINEIPCPIAP